MTELTIPAFEPFPKMGRLSRGITITEKLDGTNAQVLITEDGTMMAGSRNRWITPGKLTDNYGFAGWVAAHRDELMLLGPGRHFGEWWGNGIQRGYGMAEKRFSLFNVNRWKDKTLLPACCDVVPVLFHGKFTDANINGTLSVLAALGSTAAPGFMDPEGIVIFHHATHTLFKKTIKDDGVPKSQVAA